MGLVGFDRYLTSIIKISMKSRIAMNIMIGRRVDVNMAIMIAT